MNKQSHSKKYDFDEFQNAFHDVDQAIKNKSARHKQRLFDLDILEGYMSRPKISGNVNLKQEGGTQIKMNTNTVINNAKTATTATTTATATATVLHFASPWPFPYYLYRPNSRARTPQIPLRLR